MPLALELRGRLRLFAPSDPTVWGRTVNDIYKHLAERIRGETPDLERLVQRALRAWQRAKGVTADQDIYLDSVALNLQGFYTGLKRLFELIARHMDQNVPSGETWHRDLLQGMSLDLPDVRPAVISRDVALELDAFRRFRHLVRNVYAANLLPNKMEGLMTVLPGLWSRLRDELMIFASFLEQVIAE